MSTELKKIFLELLEKDVEFRYTVAGYLGLLEILKKLDYLIEENKKIWEEIKLLREEEAKLREEQTKIWEEIRSIREDEKKIWENINRIWEEIRLLREEQIKLREEQIKIREDISKIWDNINRIWEEIRSIKEEQKKIWEEIRELRKNYINMRKDLDALKDGMRALASAVGTTLDHYTAVFIENLLREKGVPNEKINVQVDVRIYHLGRYREIDIFNLDPLVVGEVTTNIRNIEEARYEINKIIEDIKFAEEVFNRKIFLAVLAVEVVSEDLVQLIKEETEKHGILFIYGKMIPKL
jgi:cytochrome c556